MWPVYFVISYFLLALLIPTAWALGHAWYRARSERQVLCPARGGSAVISMDRWYAVRMHVSGNPEYRVEQCTRWVETFRCGQECLLQIAPAA